MALKALMLRKKIDDKKKALDGLRSKDADFVKREADLEQSIEEAQTDEEKQTVEAEVEKFESEKEEHEKAKTGLENEISELEKDLEEVEKEQRSHTPKREERKETTQVVNRTKFFGMSIQERDAFFADENVKKFISTVRTCMKEKRAIGNVGLIIPEIMLNLLKQKVFETSKLMKYVQLRNVTGTARQVIMGDIPEAIWTEMCATLNEMDLSFNDVEVDGYKIGGYFVVCNAILEDNDVNLVTEIVNALGKAIGKGVDKAIIYGKGTKMPMGVVTRLAQTVKPDTYPASAREWKDLHESHILTGTGKTGVALFKEIVGYTSVIDNDYSETGLVWIMNKATHTKLITESMDKNLNASIVAGINNQMPVIGGDIVELPFIPDDNIVFGYFDAYLLAERAGTKIEDSGHAMFIQDRTVFKGTARYDGKPVIAEAFALMSISTTAPTTSVDFPADKANTTT